MKTAWINVTEWDGRTVGSIERVSQESEWPIFCVNNGWVTPKEFDETVIDTNFLVADFVSGEWLLSENTDAKTAAALEAIENKKQATEELRIAYGVKATAYFGRLCEDANYGLVEYEQMLSDVQLTLVERLLGKGALEATYGIFQSYTPNTYFTSQMKTSMLNKLEGYITSVNAFIGE